VRHKAADRQLTELLGQTGTGPRDLHGSEPSN
jgi:hypothetical protein